MSDIVPFDKTTIVKITSFTVDVIALQLNTSATLRVVMYNNSNNGEILIKTPVGVETILLAGDDYKQWSNDDNFVVKYVAQKFGFILC